MNNYSLLEAVQHPADLRHMSLAELKTLAGELREFVLKSVRKTSANVLSNITSVKTVEIAIPYEIEIAIGFKN